MARRRAEVDPKEDDAGNWSTMPGDAEKVGARPAFGMRPGRT